jgi:hypothetical protein
MPATTSGKIFQQSSSETMPGRFSPGVLWPMLNQLVERQIKKEGRVDEAGTDSVEQSLPEFFLRRDLRDSIMRGDVSPFPGDRGRFRELIGAYE